MAMNKCETHKLRDEEHVGDGGEDPAACGQNITGDSGSHSPKHCACDFTVNDVRPVLICFLKAVFLLSLSLSLPPPAPPSTV